MPYKDPEEHKRFQREWKRQRSLQNLLSYMEQEGITGCQDCGVFDPAFMDFHHRDGNPELRIGQVMYRPVDTWRDEAQKCDLLCSNCHRKRHYYGAVGRVDKAPDCESG